MNPGRSPSPESAELDLMSYLDGELDESRIAEVEARLASDAAYAATLRRLEALSAFVYEDRDRLFASAGFESVADAVMQKIGDTPVAAAAPALRSGSTSRQTRGSVIWVAFGAAAAAAAAVFVLARGIGIEVSSPQAYVPAPSVSPSAAETVAIASPEEGPEVAQALEPASNMQVEDLEVGAGATVIYREGGGGSSAVVWVNAREGAQ